ncbi:MAG: hypothetical protein ACJ762_06435 [Solirubrobacteraceae bacterium]
MLTHVDHVLIVADLHAETFARLLCAESPTLRCEAPRFLALKAAVATLDASREQGRVPDGARRHLAMDPQALDPASAAWIQALQRVARRHVEEATRDMSAAERQGLLPRGTPRTFVGASGRVVPLVGGGSRSAWGHTRPLHFFAGLESRLGRAEARRNGR